MGKSRKAIIMMRFLFAVLLITLSAVTLPALAQDNSDAAPAKEAPTPTKDEVLAITKYDHVLGDKNAPITIIEYASLSCPHCAEFHKDTFPELKKEYIDTGKVKFVFRDFQLDKSALEASILTHCTDSNDSFYKMVKTIFHTQDSWAGQKNYLEILSNIGKLGGVPGDKLDKCLADKDLENRLLAVRLNAAKALNISATPSFIINGSLYSGAQPISDFRKILDELLAAKSDDAQKAE